MKMKFNDFVRCLIFLKNPCDCKPLSKCCGAPMEIVDGRPDEVWIMICTKCQKAVDHDGTSLAKDVAHGGDFTPPVPKN